MLKKIFVIEDEPDMLNLLKFLLSQEGYEVFCFSRGEEAIREINQGNTPDLVLLDLMLPGMSGFEVCRNVKSNSETWDIPLIMLTSRSDEFDILNGFNVGCDDYVTKPFSEKILLAKVKAVLLREERKNKPPEKNNILQIADIYIDKDKYEVSIKGKLKNMTASEFKVLLYLVENQGKVYTREQIYSEIRDGYIDTNERSVDIIIARIRKKLGSYGKLIQSVYGVGYTFKEQPEY